MPFPPGPAKHPWRALVTRFLDACYGGGVVGPDAAFLPDPEAHVSNLGQLLPFEHDGRDARFEGGGRAYLARRILEVQAGGGVLGDGPVARLVAVALEPGGSVRFEFARGRRHDDLASGEALAAELLSAFWEEAPEDGAARPPDAEADVEALFDRVRQRLKVRQALAPDRQGLRDLTRRAVRLRVEAAVRGPAGRLVEWRPAAAEEYPRLWVLPLADGVEEEDAGPLDTLGRAADVVGADFEGPAPDAPAALAWDLLNGNLVLLVEAPGLPALPTARGRAFREVPEGSEAEFLRRSPVAPSAAAFLCGYPRTDPA